MGLDKLPPAGGNWVTGDKFFNRERERAQLRNHAQQGLHTLLTGQRRMGKTSLARQVALELGEEGWTHLIADLDDCSDPEDMIAVIATAVVKHTKDHELLKRLKESTAGLFSHVDKVGALGASISFRDKLTAGTWQQKGSALLANLGESAPCLLVIDELPNLLLRLEKTKGVEAVAQLLNWLRKAMQAVDGERKLVVFVSGSIGLEPIVQRLKLTKSINHLETMRLEPWSREIASQCLLARAKFDGIQFRSEALERLLDNIVIYIPFHVQKASSLLDSHLREVDEKEITATHVAHVYGKMVTREGATMVQHYRDRLEETVGEMLKEPALVCLNLLSDGKPRKRTEIVTALRSDIADEELDWLLKVLVHDGYLILRNSQWIFPSGLLKDWWALEVAV